VSALANSFALRDGTQCHSSEHIDLISNRFEVRRVDASAIPAEVIKDKPVWDVSLVAGEGQSVCGEVPSPDRERPVSRRSGPACPVPAAGYPIH